MDLMIALLFLGITVSTPTDTLVEVRQGDHLVIRDFQGTVHVEAWERSAFRAEVETKESVPFRIERAGRNLELRMAEGWRRNRGEDLRLILPTWMDLEIQGRELEAEIMDLAGDVTVRSLQGDLSFRNMSGRVEAYTVEGSIDALRLTGTARFRSGDDDLWVGSSSAELELETVDGDMRLEGIDARRVSARTTDGEIEFSGRVLPEGDYAFFSHSGDIVLRLAPPVDLDATMLTYDGEFESEFRVMARGFRSGEGLEFTLGSGGARLVMETFDGEIKLLRGSLE